MLATIMGKGKYEEYTRDIFKQAQNWLYKIGSIKRKEFIEAYKTIAGDMCDKIGKPKLKDEIIKKSALKIWRRYKTGKLFTKPKYIDKARESSLEIRRMKQEVYIKIIKEMLEKGKPKSEIIKNLKGKRSRSTVYRLIKEIENDL